jgi:hypothetical protein
VTSKADPNKLLELASRVEVLVDRADYASVAKDIYRQLIGAPEITPQYSYGWREDAAGWWWLATGEDARTPPKMIYPPKWLSSLDAAMTLVSEGWSPSVGQNVHHQNWYAYVQTLGTEGEPVTVSEAYGPTPALALTTAALRALATRCNDG